LLAELVPTPKIIAEFREWFPSARIVGWKYELDGDQSRAISLGLDQIARNQTHACVVNGAAYGEGFGLVSGDGTCRHVANAPELYDALFRLTST
jgi:phosphopantothenoylcysteine decarboxylase/phosphopantothenate--cysteine ligase